MLFHLCQIATVRSKGIAQYGVLQSASIGRIGWISEMELSRENEDIHSIESHGSKFGNHHRLGQATAEEGNMILENLVSCFVDVNHMGK
jgi:hypothetical protein